MLVDNESFVNILFGTTFDKMIVNRELTPSTISLYDIIGDNIISKGKITLAMEMEELPQTSLNFMKFLIVDNRLAYHGVLGRHALKDFSPSLPFTTYS